MPGHPKACKYHCKIIKCLKTIRSRDVSEKYPDLRIVRMSLKCYEKVWDSDHWNLKTEGASVQGASFRSAYCKSTLFSHLEQPFEVGFFHTKFHEYQIRCGRCVPKNNYLGYELKRGRREVMKEGRDEERTSEPNLMRSSRGDDLGSIKGVSFRTYSSYIEIWLGKTWDSIRPSYRIKEPISVLSLISLWSTSCAIYLTTWHSTMLLPRTSWYHHDVGTGDGKISYQDVWDGWATGGCG